MNKDFDDFKEFKQILSSQNQLALIKRYLISDNSFIEHLDNTVMTDTPFKLKDLPADDRLEEIRTRCIGNGSRGYILKMWILESMLTLMQDKSTEYLDSYWDKIMQQEWVKCRQNKE